MADPRLQQVFATACRLFINQGYARTQMRDIVKATGISTGALYSLFTGKRAMLGFILQCTIQPGYMQEEHTLPIDEARFAGQNEQIMHVLEQNSARFAAPLEENHKHFGFADMLSCAFDVMQAYGVGCLFIEHNPDECGPLWGYYLGYRQRFIAVFTAYIKNFCAQGEVRALVNERYCVQLMVETISWWAMHVGLDAFDPQPVPAAEAKQVCMDALLHAYGTGA